VTRSAAPAPGAGEAAPADSLTDADSRASTLLWAALGALLFVRLISLALVPVADSSEARYADIGRRMLELDDWITPWFDDGVPFWGKPPLYAWMTATGMGVFGIDGFGARLPHFLAGVLVSLVLWDWQRRERGAAQAQLAVALLWATALFYLCAGAVLTDMALLLGLMLAMRGFWRGLHAPPAERRREGRLLFVGLAIGLLAKGPIALVLASVPIAVWLLATRDVSRTWLALPWLRGTLAMLAIAVPWYLLAERRTPGFLDYFLIGEHWRRFTAPGWEGDRYGSAHLEPRGMIWVFLLLACLPWPLLLPLLARGRRTRRPAAKPPPGGAPTRESLYLWAWALWPCVLFTASRNILWTYVLPGLPALALLGAAWLARDDRPRRHARLVALGLLITAAVFVGAMTQRTFEGKTKSAHEVIAAFEALRQPGDELLFVGRRQFSVAFYGRGRYRPLPDFDALAARLDAAAAGGPSGGRRFVALRRWGDAQPPAALRARMQRVAQHQGYDLLAVVR
jgi:4-amino-4-deoxy-L-arabinose transferase-like glycosyltransferase